MGYTATRNVHIKGTVWRHVSGGIGAVGSKVDYTTVFEGEGGTLGAAKVSLAAVIAGACRKSNNRNVKCEFLGEVAVQKTKPNFLEKVFAKLNAWL